MNSDKLTSYGSAFDHLKSEALPRADHILGAVLVSDPTDQPLGVTIHWDSPDGQKKVALRFPDAMLLLAALKSIQLDTETPFPDDPREGRETRIYR